MGKIIPTQVIIDNNSNETVHSVTINGVDNSYTNSFGSISELSSIITKLLPGGYELTWLLGGDLKRNSKTFDVGGDDLRVVIP